MNKKTRSVGFASAAPKETDKLKASKKRSELKPKQAKAVQGVLDGKSMRQAAKDAGYSQAMANSPGKVFTPAVREVMASKLEELGCTDEHLAQRIMEGTNAEVVKFATFEGRISDERTYVDMEQRGKYIDRALELKGHTKRGGAAVEVNMPVTLIHSVPRPVNMNG